MTPQQLMLQWEEMPHKLSLNAWNFEVKAAEAAKEVFLQSFDNAKFNATSAVAWPARKRAANHPMLNETGTLKKSIKWRSNKGSSDSENHSVTIYTDPSAFGTAARHKGYCYAAIHNDGKSSINIAQRQFIGDSDVLDRKLKELSVMIFEGFPR